MPSLRLTAPGRPPTVYHLYKKLTSIGSGPDNDVVLPDPLIGDAYATIQFDGQTYTITTLARNATTALAWPVATAIAASMMVPTGPPPPP